MRSSTPLVTVTRTKSMDKTLNRRRGQIVFMVMIISGEGELRGQPANPGSPGKMAIKTECVCVLYCIVFYCVQCFDAVG